MSNITNSDGVQHEWVIEGDVGRSLYKGFDSEETLGNLFTMWIKDRGDVSDWSNAPVFGKFIATHGDLSAVVVAVWLGIGLEDIDTASLPVGELPWEFEGPDNHMLTLNRNHLAEEDDC